MMGSNDAARRRWRTTVTLAEGFGYFAPATAGIVTARLGIEGVARAVLISAGGFLEGLALGAGQARAFPFRVDRRRFALLTATGAFAVWAGVMSAMLLASSDAVPLAVGAGVAAGITGLVALGGAQWLELRRRVPGAHRWIAWTALAWLLALPVSFLPSPFVDETTPLAVHFVVWIAAGFAMAYVMAVVTWQGVRRLAVS
jgi:hypothetical protein